jgi:hypothetical protein
MTVRAPHVSRLFALWLAAGLVTVAAGCRGSDSSAGVEEAAFASRNRQGEDFASRNRLFEECCQRQFRPGRYRDECLDEARHGRCRLDCRPPRDAGAPDRASGGSDAGVRDAGVADGPAGNRDAGTHDAGATDGHAGSPDAGHDAGASICPTLTPIFAGAGPVIVGGLTKLTVDVLDPNDFPAGVSTLWSATEQTSIVSSGVTFVPPDEAEVTAEFACPAAGTNTVSVLVNAGACRLTGSISLTCTLCGDGIVEAGEDCDPPNLTPDGRILCDETCHFIAACGNGQLDPGEQCDPPNPGICGNNCQFVAAVCGDGIIQQGEQCDPPHQGPDGLQCGANCQLLTCGNGVIDPGEQCDPPKSSGTAPLCSQTCQIPTCGNGVIDPGETCDPPTASVCDANCQSIPSVCGDDIVEPGEQCDGTPFCNQCQETACGGCFFAALEVAGLGGEPACSSVSGTARTNCLSLLSCLTQDLAGCFFQLGTNRACFCGPPTCPSAPNGQCGSQFEAVAGTTDPTVVVQQLSDPTSLVSRVVAEGQAFADFPACGEECSLE